MTAEGWPLPPGGRRSEAGGLIRPYAATDRQAVRDIACRTAFRNRGAEWLFEDRELHADYWTRYFTDVRPEDCLVVEEDGQVIGYLLGERDHAHFVRTMGTRIVPPLVARALWRLATGRYRNPQTRRYLWHMLRHGGAEAPRLPYDRFPASYHCNVLRRGYGKRYYSELVLLWLDRLDALGIDGVHGHITETAEAGIWQRFAELFGTEGLKARSERPTRLFERVVGDQRRWVNRGWATDLATYRRWIEWLRAEQRI